MMYVVELLTSMTLIHTMDFVPIYQNDPIQGESITANNDGKKKDDSSGSNKNDSKKSPTKSPSKSTSSKKSTSKSNTSKSNTTKSNTTKSSSHSTTSSQRPSQSSQRPSQTSGNKNTTSSQRPSQSSQRPSQSSQRPSQSHSSSKATNPSKTSQTSQRPSQSHSSPKVTNSSSSKSVHPSQRGHQNQGQNHGTSAKGLTSPQTHGSKASPKDNQYPHHGIKSTQTAKDSVLSDKIKEHQEHMESKKENYNQNKPNHSIKDQHPPQHKPSTAPNRGNRYDPTIDRGTTGQDSNRQGNNQNSGKLDNSIYNNQQNRDQVGGQGLENREANHRDSDNQSGFSSDRNRGPVVIVVEKPSSTPNGWNPEIHRESSTESRHWHPNYWGAGVFYYTDPPQNVYIEEHNYYGDTVRKYEAPKREYDRRKSLSVGVRGGTLGSQVEDFSQDDISWGGAVGYRLFDPIGIEISYLKTGDEWTTGLKSPVQVSGNLYLFPWTGVSPYLTGGISIAEQAGAKNQTDFDLPDGYAYGPHGGIGVEWGIGNHISLNAEGRYTKFKNVDATHTQLAAGLNFYF